MCAFRNRNKSCCNAGPIAWLKKLSLPDGSEVSVIGLDAIFDDLCKENKRPSKDVASEIVRRLSRKNNIPRSLVAQYEDAVLREFTAFAECKVSNEAESSRGKRTSSLLRGLLSHLKGRAK